MAGLSLLCRGNVEGYLIIVTDDRAFRALQISKMRKRRDGNSKSRLIGIRFSVFFLLKDRGGRGSGGGAKVTLSNRENG